MNYEKMTKTELISKLKSLESGIVNTGSSAEKLTLQGLDSKYQKFIESLNDAVLLVDVETGIILATNKRAEDLLGVPVEEIVGMHFMQTHPAEDIERNKKIFIKYSRRKSAITTEDIFMQHKNGRKIPVEISLNVIKRGGKNVMQGIIRDITERKQIKDSEVLYRTVFDQAVDSIVIVDADTGKILEFNDRAHQNLDYTREEFEKLKLADIDAIESHKDVMERIGIIKKTGAFSFETKHKTKAGKLRDLTISARTLSIQGQNIFSCIWHDITEQKRTEEDLRKKNSYLKLLQVAAVAANEAEDIKDAFHPVLEEICSYTGWEIGHAYVVSVNDSDLLAPTTFWCLKDHKHFKKFCDISTKIEFARGIGLPGRVLESRKPHWIMDVTKDNNFLRTSIAKAMGLKSGIAFPVMVGSKVVAVLTFFTTKKLEPDQQFMEIMAKVGTQLGRTIERRQAEEAEEEFKRIFELSIDMISIADSETYLFTKVNPAFMKILGYTDKELLTKPVLEFVHPDDRNKTIDIIKKKLLLGTPLINFENRFRCKDGSYKWLMWTSRPVPEQRRTYSIARDITVHKQMEEAILQSEKMKAMGIMAAGVAHEFNNILAVISSNAQFLEETNRSDKDLTETLRTICSMADDGAEIVDRMYDFTNIRKDTSSYMGVDLIHLINQVIGFTMPRWKEMAQASGTKYQIVRKGVKALPSVFGNPSELREVILNIINNALDAMPGGGTITVTARRIRSEESGVEGKKKKVSKLPARTTGGRAQSSELQSNFVEISFRDTGNGMTEDIKKAVFDPFFTTRSPQGTGLGMSVSYGIITRHGGEINVKSKQGKGTEIKLSLPITDKSIPHVVISGQDSKSDVDGLKILLVDDKKEICESLGKIFTDDGHKVCSINNGTDAIKLLKKNSYDLLICDLVMPDVNGRDILNAIKTMNNRPKVALITGWKYKMEDAEKEGLDLDFIVKKPFNLSKLRSDINNLWS